MRLFLSGEEGSTSWLRAESGLHVHIFGDSNCALKRGENFAWVNHEGRTAHHAEHDGKEQISSTREGAMVWSSPYKSHLVNVLSSNGAHGWLFKAFKWRLSSTWDNIEWRFVILGEFISFMIEPSIYFLEDVSLECFQVIFADIIGIAIPR